MMEKTLALVVQVLVILLLVGLVVWIFQRV